MPKQSLAAAMVEEGAGGRYFIYPQNGDNDAHKTAAITTRSNNR